MIATKIFRIAQGTFIACKGNLHFSRSDDENGSEVLPKTRKVTVKEEEDLFEEEAIAPEVNVKG